MLSTGEAEEPVRAIKNLVSLNSISKQNSGAGEAAGLANGPSPPRSGGAPSVHTRAQGRGPRAGPGSRGQRRGGWVGRGGQGPPGLPLDTAASGGSILSGLFSR